MSMISARSSTGRFSQARTRRYSESAAPSFFLPGWTNYLSAPNAPNTSMMTFIYVSLFASRKWYDLAPDQNHTVVTGGYGTSGQTNYVTAASTPDGTLAMAYVPGSTTLTVALSGFRVRVTTPAVRPDESDVTAVGAAHPRTAGRLLATPERQC